MSVAFLFPGQGSQKVGMGQALAASSPECREAFEEADLVLGIPLSTLCFAGPEAELGLTVNTQPALLAASVATARALFARGVRPDRVAGHSLGEYSALVAAGSMTLAEGLQTVRLRGQYMQEAVPVGLGAMAAVLGLELSKIEEACREAQEGEVVAPANINGPGQVVIAGHTAAVERASLGCRARGAKKVIRLPVSAPFHCSLMTPAQERLKPVLDRVAFEDPSVPLVRNVDAAVVSTAEACRDGLLRQVSSPVRWQEVVERLVADGVKTFVEVGPGSVLSGLVRKIAGDARSLSVQDPESLQRVVEALEGSGVAR